jgi:uncharacterized protein (UPF0335 family)
MSQLRALVERIERVETDIAELNSDKRDIYAEAKANGFDVKALKAVISYRRKDTAEREELETLVDLYLAELSGKSSVGTPSATRVHVHEAKSPAPVVQAQPSAAPVQSAPYEFPDLPTHLDRRVSP